MTLLPATIHTLSPSHAYRQRQTIDLSYSSLHLPSYFHLRGQSRFCQSANPKAEEPLEFRFVLNTVSELLAVSKSCSSQAFHSLHAILTFSFNG